MIEGYKIGDEEFDITQEEIDEINLDEELGEIQDDSWDDEVKGDHAVDE